MYSKVRSTMLVLALFVLLAGLAACAKYPVLVNNPGATPPAASPATGR